MQVSKEARTGANVKVGAEVLVGEAGVVVIVNTRVEVANETAEAAATAKAAGHPRILDTAGKIDIVRTGAEDHIRQTHFRNPRHHPLHHLARMKKRKRKILMFQVIPRIKGLFL